MNRSFQRCVWIVSIATLLSFPLPSAGRAGGTADFIVDVLLPGRGQARDGRYTRAAILGGTAIAGWSGLLVAQVNYNRAVDEFEEASSTYRGFAAQLGSGQIVAQSTIDATWTEVGRSFNSAEDRYTARNLFIGGVALVYALNLVDLLTSEPATGELESMGAVQPAWQIELRPDRVALERRFHF